MTSRVAIITRTRDRHLLLQRAIQSVLNQSFTDWVHIIVNDGGPASDLDRFLKPFKSAYKGRLQVIHHPQSTGMQQAANQGILQSQSEFISIHDDDDSWEPDYLTQCVQFLDLQGPKSKYQGVISHSTLVEESISRSNKITTLTTKDYIPLPEISLFRLGFENPFPPIAFLYRRSAFDAVGPYNPEFNVAGDYDFNFRFLLKYEIGIVPLNLAHYHIRTKADRDEDLNSVTQGADEHKIRYNELKNHYLRGENPSISPSLALALNAAKYLVEIEWVTHEARARAARIDPKVDQLHTEICGDAYSDRFCSIRDALATIIDHLRNPHAQNTLDAINLKTDDILSHQPHLAQLLHDLTSKSDDLLNHQSYLARVLLDLSSKSDNLLNHHPHLVQLLHDLTNRADTLILKNSELQTQSSELLKHHPHLVQLLHDLTNRADTLILKNSELQTQSSELLKHHPHLVQLLHDLTNKANNLTQITSELQSQHHAAQAHNQEQLEALDKSQSERLEEQTSQVQQWIQDHNKNLLAQQEAYQQANTSFQENTQQAFAALTAEINKLSHPQSSKITLFKLGPVKITWTRKTPAPAPNAAHNHPQ